MTKFEPKSSEAELGQIIYDAMANFPSNTTPEQEVMAATAALVATNTKKLNEIHSLGPMLAKMLQEIQRSTKRHRETLDAIATMLNDYQWTGDLDEHIKHMNGFAEDEEE